MKIYTYTLCAIVVWASLLPQEVFAATQSVTANISFDATLAIIKGNDINFGMVEAGKAGTYVISPTGEVEADDGGVYIGGTTQAGSLTITGSTTQAIDIAVNNYVADAGATPSAATCAYNSGSPAPCPLTSQAAPGDGKPLLVGVSLAVDGTQTAGTSAAPSFEVVVNYQ